MSEVAPKKKAFETYKINKQKLVTKAQTDEFKRFLSSANMIVISYRIICFNYFNAENYNENTSPCLVTSQGS